MGCGSSVVQLKGDNSKEIRITDEKISNSDSSLTDHVKSNEPSLKLDEEGKRYAKYTDDQCENENSEVGKTFNKTTAVTLSTNNLTEDQEASKTKPQNDNEINKSSEEICMGINTGSSNEKENVKESRESSYTDDVEDSFTTDTQSKKMNMQDRKETNSTDYQRMENKLEDENTDKTKQENDNQTDSFLEKNSTDTKTEKDQEIVLQEHVNESEKFSQPDVVGEYSAIDAHARQAPSSVGNSVEDLANYMFSFSNEPKILVRGFFVWIAENIRYDVVGCFNKKVRAPCDTASVMKHRICVCQGYANVLAALCSHVQIPVENVIGYAKSLSFDECLPLRMPDHVWNVVQLDGNWYLIDNTWGAGYLDQNKTFNKRFNEFYFLTEPKHFISSHYPFMSSTANATPFGPTFDHMMNFARIDEESKKWQLLSKPITLEQFQKNARCTSEAYKLGFEAVSHPHEHISMEHEIELQFKTTKPEGIIVHACIMRAEGAMFVEQPNATFVVTDNNTFNIVVHPRAVGLYMLKILGKHFFNESNQKVIEMMSYYITCTQVKDSKFEFPQTLEAAGREKVVLHEPRRGNLIEESTVHFRLSAPYLQRIKVGDTYLNKEADVFTGDVTVKSTNQLIVSGSRRNDKQILEILDVLYIFKICQKKQQQTLKPIISKHRQNTRRAL